MQAQYPDLYAVNIATSQSRTNTAYGTLTTPDQVTVKVPDMALLEVFYYAVWQNSVASAGRAAIFLGSNQLQYVNNPTNVVSEATGNSTANVDMPLSSYPLGLATGNSATGISAPPTTGMAISAGAFSAVGGACPVFVDPGSYVVGIQFKSSSGSVTVKNRKLWVRVSEPSGRA